MSDHHEHPPLVRATLKALDALSTGVDKVEKATQAMGRNLKQSATRTPAAVSASTTADANVAQEQRTAKQAQSAAKRAAIVAKIRTLCFPDGSQVDPARASWAQTKSIISVLGAAAVGGIGGIFLYATPFLFPVLMLVALPLAAIGTMVRGLGLMLSKGSDLRQDMKRIGNRALAVATTVALAPMILVGIPAFAALHASLSLADGVVNRPPTAETNTPARPLLGNAIAQTQRWSASMGKSFNKAFARKSKQSVSTAPTDTAPAQTNTDTTPKPQG